MKKSRILASLLAIVIAAAALAGCSFLKPTAIGLIRKMAGNMDKVTSVKSSIVIEYDGSVNTGFGNLDIGLDADLDMESAKSTGVSHVSGTLSGSLFGLSLDMPVESYMQTQENALTTYTSVDGRNWIRKTTDPGDNAGAQNFKLDGKTILAILTKIKDKEITADLAEETEKIGDRDAYRIDIMVKGDLIGELIRASAASGREQAQALQDIDFSGADVNVVLYIYRDDNMPARVQADCTALGGILIQEQIREEGLDLSTERFVVTVDFTEFNTIDSLEIPEEVKSSAKEGDVDLFEDMMPGM